MKRLFRQPSSVAWARAFEVGASSSIDAVVNHDRSIYAIGYSAQTPGRSGGRETNHRIFVARLEPDGTLTFDRQLDGSGDTWVWGAAANDGIYVCGAWQPTAGKGDPNEARGFVARLDSDAQIVWRTEVGSLTGDWPTTIAVHEDLVYVAGHTHGRLPGQERRGSADGFVASLDREGKLLWARQAGCGGHDGAFGAAADAEGVWIIAQCSFPAERQAHPRAGTIVRRYSRVGTLEWTRAFGGGGSTEYPHAIVIKGATLALLGGSEGIDGSSMRGWVRTMEGLTGEVVADRADDRQGRWFHAATASRHGMIACGTAGHGHADRLYDGFVTAFAPNLEESDFQPLGTETKDVATSIVIGPDRGIYVGGRSTRPDHVNGGARANGHWESWNGWVVRLEREDS